MNTWNRLQVCLSLHSHNATTVCTSLCQRREEESFALEHTSYFPAQNCKCDYVFGELSCWNSKPPWMFSLFFTPLSFTWHPSPWYIQPVWILHLYHIATIIVSGCEHVHWTQEIKGWLRFWMKCDCCYNECDRSEITLHFTAIMSHDCSPRIMETLTFTYKRNWAKMYRTEASACHVDCSQVSFF